MLINKNRFFFVSISFVILIFFNINLFSCASVIPLNIQNSNIIWEKKNLNIYIQDNNILIKKKFLNWNDKIGNIFEFKFVEEIVDADIAVLIVDEENPKLGAYTVFFYKDKTFVKVLICLPKKDFSSNKINRPISLFVITHEIGHALGILNHSENKSDIMFYKKTNENNDITNNDIKMLKSVYSEKKKQTIIYNEKEHQHDLPYVANAYKNAGKYNEAIEIYNKILEEMPEFTPAIYSKGFCYFKQKNYKEAEIWFEKAYKRESQNVIYLNSYVRVLYILKKKNSAVKILNKFVHENPKEKNSIIIKDLYTIINKHE